MTTLSAPIQELVEELRKLPGVGPKTAQRLTYHLLKLPHESVEKLSQKLLRLTKDLQVCSTCYNITETDPCNICQKEDRDATMICVVEEPLDLLAIEKTRKYEGLYHVLGGAINPLQGIGPDELRIDELISRAQTLSDENKEVEIILATNPSMEGEATAMYIRKHLGDMSGIKTTRIARGLPTGGDVEYADQVTLGRALEGRSDF